MIKYTIDRRFLDDDKVEILDELFHRKNGKNFLYTKDRSDKKYYNSKMMFDKFYASFKELAYYGSSKKEDSVYVDHFFDENEGIFIRALYLDDESKTGVIALLINFAENNCI